MPTYTSVFAATESEEVHPPPQGTRSVPVLLLMYCLRQAVSVADEGERRSPEEAEDHVAGFDEDEWDKKKADVPFL